MGAALFDRMGKRLVLNEHGRLLFPRARALLDQARDLGSLFDSEAASLSLGASTTIANYLLPPLIARFRKARPSAKVTLEVANTARIVDAVASFTVDAGLIEGPCHHPELRVEPWQLDRLSVVVASSHPLAGRPVTLGELAEAPWLLREPGSGTREVVERLLLPHLGTVNLEMELGDSEAIKRSVAAGLGVSCLSRCVTEELLASGALVEVDAPLPTLERPLYRIMHRDKAMTRALAAFFGDEASQPE